MSRFLLVVVLLVVMTGCAAQRCDKVREYQKTVAKIPITVPADLSAPQLRSLAPEVETNPATRRADGRCLEAPPAFEPEPEAEEEGSEGQTDQSN